MGFRTRWFTPFRPEELDGVARRALEDLALRVVQVAELAVREQVRVAEDDVERRAQLVRHRRDEVGLQAVRRREIGDQARVLEGYRRGVGDARGEPSLPLPELALFAPDEGEDADQVGAAVERGEERGAEREVLREV